mmetsp:Transcript_11823/g.26355  ORF Transcript_11823/g.26355 Transcript_11823/m.26355 type:complete len:230 (+) Transcript_11823:636-1325(+)
MDSEPTATTSKEPLSMRLELRLQLIRKLNRAAAEGSTPCCSIQRDTALMLKHSAKIPVDKIVSRGLQKLSPLKCRLKSLTLDHELRGLLKECRPQIRLLLRSSVQENWVGPVDHAQPTLLLAVVNVPQGEGEHREEAVRVLTLVNNHRRARHAWSTSSRHHMLRGGASLGHLVYQTRRGLCPAGENLCQGRSMRRLCTPPIETLGWTLKIGRKAILNDLQFTGLTSCNP